jgi:ribosomal protein S11
MNYSNNNGGGFGADFPDFSDDKIHVETAEETAARISRKQLEQLAGNLEDRQHAILQAMQHTRFMTSGQVADFGFGDAATPSAAQRAANRTLHHLQDNGLISSLERRVGGARAGSSSFVWGLTNPGFRLLNLDSDTDQPRKRPFEPSPRFLNHTLGVTELYIQLLGMNGVTITDIQFEPQCWRDYTGTGGIKEQLKPDLYAVTTDGTYDDSWYFELDLATETPARVISKCEQYEGYYNSNAEQRQSGVFPLVVWLVPDSKRKEAVQSHIAQSPLRHKDLFTVIVPEELEGRIRQGAGL